MEVFGAMAKSGGRHQSAAKMVAAICLSFDSLDHHRPKLWEMAVEKVRWSRCLWSQKRQGGGVG